MPVSPETFSTSAAVSLGSPDCAAIGASRNVSAMTAKPHRFIHGSSGGMNILRLGARMEFPRRVGRRRSEGMHARLLTITLGSVLLVNAVAARVASAQPFTLDEKI